ncbi:MAG: PP2C family protein-serine/threonine phosphatase [Bacteroidia bacterium]
MKNFLNKIVNAGITANSTFEERNKLRVFNNANLVIFCISVFYSIIGIYNHYFIAVSVTMFSVLSNVLSFVLVKRGYYRLAFHYTVWYGFVFLSAFSYLFGGANNSYYYFLFMPVAINILFDNLKITLTYLLISAGLMIANVYFIDNYPPHYDVAEWMHYFSYPNILFATGLIFLGVRLFKQENILYAGQIEEQRKALEEKNHEITDSINYAKKIQSALIPSEEEFNSYFRDSFVMLKPKDIVSGDFYWITRKENKLFYVTADCTGHGVPGGFMTMLGISFLDEIINEKNVVQPAEILNQLRDRIIQTLKQTGNAGESKDGMDVILTCMDADRKTLTYSAANNSLYILRGGVIQEHKPDKQPCGFYHEQKPFTQHTIQLEEGDCVYSFSDGYADQFGGEKGKKFKYRQLEQKLIAICNRPMKEQKQALSDTIEAWRGNLEQVDDILLVGIRI